MIPIPVSSKHISNPQRIQTSAPPTSNLSLSEATQEEAEIQSQLNREEKLVCFQATAATSILRRWSAPHVKLPDNVWKLLSEASDISSQPIDCSIESQATLLAKHATLSRFLTSLVNEGLVLGNIMLGMPPTSLGSVCQPLKLLALRERNISSHLQDDASTANIETTKYLVLLKRFPMVREVDRSRSALIDPLDFTSIVADISALKLVTDTGRMMEQIGEWNNYEQDVIHKICLEMANSIEHQAYRYAHPSTLKLTADSPLIDWEQSIVEGHPTHPMHRMRYTVPPTKLISPSTDLYNVNVRYVIVPKNELIITGDFSNLVKPFYAFHLKRFARAKKSKAKKRIKFNQASELIVPVHEYHLPNVQYHFRNARLLPKWFSTRCKVQSSQRTLNYIGYDKYSIKLPVGIKLTSTLRTITPWTAYLGPRINQALDAVITDKKALIALREPASVCSANPDFDIAKHLACIVREDAEALTLPNERVVLCLALTESLPSAVSPTGRALPFMHNIWGNRLTTLQGRLDFLKEYATAYLKAFLPPVINHGFTFEAHQQNTLVRFNKDTLHITGFMVRDYGDIRYFPEKLRVSTRHLPTGPIEIETLPGHVIKAESIEAVYLSAFHTMIQSHLHTVIKSLGLFRIDEDKKEGVEAGYEGWDVVRDILYQIIPQDHELYKLWLQSTEAQDKALLSMQIAGVAREHKRAKIPNIILMRG